MANLIPAEHLKTYSRNMLMRIMFGISIAMIFCAGIIVLGLLPAYFDIRIEYEGRSLVLKTLEQPQKEEGQSERTVVQNIRKRVTALDTLGKKQGFSAALEGAIESRPKGVTLNSFIYTHKDGAGTLNISGVASDSGLVKTYTEVLRGSALFEKVTIPLTALAYTEGGGFSISAEGEF